MPVLVLPRIGSCWRLGLSVARDVDRRPLPPTPWACALCRSRPSPGSRRPRLPKPQHGHVEQSCSGPWGFRSSVGDLFVFPVWMQAEFSFSLKTTFSLGAAKPRHPSRPFAWHPGRPSMGTCRCVFSRDGCLHALLTRWCQCRCLESFSGRAVIRRWKRGVGVGPAVEPPSYWL